MVPPVKFGQPIQGGKDMEGSDTSSNLWVGNLSTDVTDAELMALFSRHGAIDTITSYTSRGFAFVYYKQVDDAKAAMAALRGTNLRGIPLKIELAKPDQWPDHRDGRDGQFHGRSMGVLDSSWMLPDVMRNHPDSLYPGSGRPQSPVVRKADGLPSRVLLIGYPASSIIDDQMLHNAMILFGEIEGIKSSPTKNYALVEFRSVDEARRAKEGLQGRLFNDPRISIMYSRPEVFPNEPMFQPPHLDMFGNNHPRIHGQEVNESSAMSGPNWRRLSPAPGLLPTPQAGMKRPVRAGPGWDVYDANQLPLESKRSRVEDDFMGRDSPFRSKKMEEPGMGLKRNYEIEIGRRGPVGPGFIWRGIIAKGGSPVCGARCVPVGKGIESDLPEVVNCSARTGLDMLTKHYADASGFDIVYFLPDAEEDFPSYTDFLRYLGAKNRAGVAKFDDGTTLFLVPPSDFLIKVLNIMGPERLYGVVLKFPPVPNTSAMPILPSISQYGNDQQNPSRKEYNGNPSKEELALPTDYNRAPSLNAPPSEIQSFPSKTNSYSTQPISQATSQAAVTLTPELIATLASLIPTTVKSTGADSSQPSLSSVRPALAPVVGDNNVQTGPHGWPQDHHLVPQQTNAYHPIQQVENQSYYQAPPQVPQSFPSPNFQGQPQAQGYPNSNFQGQHQIQNFPSASNVSSHYQDPTVSSGPLPNSIIPSHNGQLGVSYPYGIPRNEQTDSMGVVYGQSSLYQPTPYSGPFSNPINQQPNLMPMASGNIRPELPNQFYGGAGQGSSSTEVDKNQRYQSTLQFAANILQQLHQTGQGPPPSH
ncbi:flowering time control protein FPA-like isoform X2 [Impatiens glandulifera]|uniref:flowering time control protein FPA-like isoform X2 n=1 Tax=Impatiens glandulifera TaxID=253017 RepID=UPI001FB050C7|nr:flowering time control protein FPA-like isoform X2 [Impatiens glandulifera]